MSYGLIQETYTKALTTSTVEVFKQNVQNAEFITLEVTNVSNPLTSFTVQMKGHTASGLNDMYSTSHHYTNPKGLLRGSGCDMTTLNGTSWLMLDIRGIIEVAVTASSSSTSDITIRVGG